MQQTTEASFLDEKKFEFKCNYGEIDSPESLIEYFIYLRRRTGRTTALIETIAKTIQRGDLIGLVVHELSYGKSLVKMLLERRPDVQEKQIVLITPNSWDLIARGQILTATYVDDAVLDMQNINFVKQINQKGPLPYDVFKAVFR